MSLDPISAGLDFISKIADKVWPDPAAKSEALFKLEELRQSGELARLTADTDLAKAQIEVNKIEAASSNLFVSGWRPFIGWVCGGAYAYTFIIQPFFVFIVKSRGIDVDLPTLGMAELSPVLFGLLGLGAMRSYDKKIK